jgi:hypothetical protein
MKRWLVLLTVNSFVAGILACPLAWAVPPTIQPGSWTLAILPDTQYYAAKYPDIFYAQTRFLAQQKQALNIVFVLHEGDVTQNNRPEEWKVASKAFTTLEEAGIPYALLPGNHDYTSNGGRRSSCLMEKYFPLSRLSAQKTFGGVYPGEPQSPHNSFWLFHAGGKEWLVLALEFGPREEVLRWADGILKKYPERQAMIVTHAYLYWDNTRLDWQSKGRAQKGNPHDYPLAELPGGANDGQQIFEKLKENPNLQFIFSGHNYNQAADEGCGYRADECKHGNVVHQILANYQYFRGRKCGDGYLRLLEFMADGRKVHVRTYSPSQDAALTDEENDFMLALTPAEVLSGKNHSGSSNFPGMRNYPWFSPPIFVSLMTRRTNNGTDVSSRHFSNSQDTFDIELHRAVALRGGCFRFCPGDDGSPCQASRRAEHEGNINLSRETGRKNQGH